MVPLALTTAAAVVDVRHRTISDVVPLAIAGWGAAATTFGWGLVSWASVAMGLTVAAAVGVAMFFAGGFGGGDAKLIASLGVVLGLAGTVWVLLYIAVAGGLLGVVAAARGRRTLAYGPAIALGLLVYTAQMWNGQW